MPTTKVFYAYELFEESEWYYIRGIVTSTLQIGKLKPQPSVKVVQDLGGGT